MSNVTFCSVAGYKLSSKQLENYQQKITTKKPTKKKKKTNFVGLHALN